MRQVGKGILAIILGTLLLFGAAFAYAQTDSGKRQISGLVEDQLSRTDQQAAIQELGGFLPFDVRLGRFSLADDEGVWLEVEQARFDMSPTELLKGTIHVRELGAERVAVERLPDLPPATEDEDESGFTLPEPPELPESLPRIIADRIYVNQIQLAEPVLGQAAEFTLNGQGSTGDDGTDVTADLSLDRTDQPTASAELTIGADLTSEVIDIHLTASETGGLMEAVSGVADAGDLSLALEGSGPLSNWQAALNLDAQNLMKSQIDLNLAYDDLPSIDLMGFLIPHPGALPDGFETVIGQQLDLALRAGQRSESDYSLDDLQINSALLTVTGQAHADLASKQLEGAITGQIADASLASTLAGVPLAGSAILDLTASGSTDAPAFDLKLSAQDITADIVRVARVNTDVQLSLKAPIDQPFDGFDINGTGAIRGIGVEGATMPEPDIDLALEATLPLDGEAKISTLSLKGQHVSIDGNAAVSMPSMDGSASLQANVANLGEFLQAAVPDSPSMRGGANLEVDTKLGNQLNDIDGTVSLTTQNIGALPGDIDPIVGASPDLTGSFNLADQKQLTLRDLSLRTAMASLVGEVALGLEGDAAIDGSLRLNIPSLQPVEGVIDQAIDGEVDAVLTLAGTQSEPKVNLNGELSNLKIADRSFETITIAAIADGPIDALNGSADIEAKQENESLTLATTYALAAETLNLSELQILGPKTELDGEASIDLATLESNGSLKGKIEDLAALRPWHGQVLDGAITIDADANAKNGTQNADIHLNGTNIRGEFGAIGTLNVTANGKDLLGAVAVDANAKLDRFESTDILIDQANLSIKGDKDNYDVSASAQGRRDGPFLLSSSARISPFGDQKQLYLDDLSGTLAGQKIELVNPATLTLDNGVLDLDQLDLKVGKAQIQGDINIDKSIIRAEAKLNDFALGSLGELGGPDLTGTLGAELNIDGPLSAPSLTFSALADGVRMADPAFASDPLARVEVKSNIADGRLASSLFVKEISDEPIALNLTIPLKFSLDPLAYQAATNQAIEGTFKANTNIAPLVRLATLDGQELNGQLIADLTLSGTRDQPSIEGDVKLEKGQFADSLSGIVLGDVTLLLAAKGTQVELTELSARDRSTGTLNASGSVNIGLKNGYPFDVDVKSDKLVVLDNDLGRALATGDIKIGGDLTQGSATGTIKIDRADLNVPSGGGISPPDLSVHEVGLSAPFRPRQTSPGGFANYVVALNLDIAAPQEIFVRGRGLQTEWGGNLSVKGDSTAPTIGGQLDYRRGYLDFLTKRFNITEGTIRFTGGQNPIPQVEITARAQGETLVAIVTIDGPANDLDIDLTSDPVRPRDEILADVLFGSEPGELSPAQAIGLANAVAQLEGGGVDAVGKLRQLTGLDTLDVGGDNPDDPTASAGKYVGNNVFVEVERGVEAESGRARVEIELTPSFSVGTEVLEEGQTGVGFEWSYDF